MQKIIKTKNYEELSNLCKDLMLEEIKNKPNSNICLASGASTNLTYDLFVNEVKNSDIDLSNTVFTKLDEWVGISKDSSISCEKFIVDKIINPLNIKKDNYISFNPEEDPYVESDRIKKIIEDKGIDLCILGLGKNGHLGLNEPEEYLYPYSHVINISDTTKTHQMLKGNSMEKGMTLGMKELLDSKKIILIISGEGKGEIVEKLMNRKISSLLPASFLWLHNNLTIIYREDEYNLDSYNR